MLVTLVTRPCCSLLSGGVTLEGPVPGLGWMHPTPKLTRNLRADLGRFTVRAGTTSSFFSNHESWRRSQRPDASVSICCSTSVSPEINNCLLPLLLGFLTNSSPNLAQVVCISRLWVLTYWVLFCIDLLTKQHLPQPSNLFCVAGPAQCPPHN